MIVADTSGLLALFNEREPRHEAVRLALAQAGGTMVVSPYVVAELDYLIAARIGVSAELAVLRELSGPGYELAVADASLLQSAAEVIQRYAEQRIGLTDASIVVLAQKHRTARVLTLDRRHFDMLRTLDGKPFDVIP